MKPLILVTNDDGVQAKGLKYLTEAARQHGDVVVVAPTNPQSGMSHAITVKVPLQVKLLNSEPGLTVYSCTGTPVDCVKLAFDKILNRKPDLVVSGINHGANSSSSVFYSGTMGAAIEGCINDIPSVGFSLLNFEENADFEASKTYAGQIILKVLSNGIPKATCLNVNIPDVAKEKIAGIRVVRQNKGFWKEEFDKRVDPYGREYFWLTGNFHNAEPNAEDTDEWALKHNFISIVPLQIDLTCYTTLAKLKAWEIN